MAKLSKGERVRRARGRKHLSQAELGRKIQCSEDHVRKFETNPDYRWPFELALRAHRVLGVPFPQLLTDEQRALAKEIKKVA